MKKGITQFLKKHGISILLIAGIGAYVYVSGTTRACATCSAVTDFIGLSTEE